MTKETTPPRRVDMRAAMLPGCALWAPVMPPVGDASATTSPAASAQDVTRGEVVPSSAETAIQTAHSEKSSDS